MKKKLLLGMSTLLLSCGLTVTNTADAAETNINYLNTSIVNKVKAGTLTLNGYKIGQPASKYYYSKQYKHKSKRVFEIGKRYDKAFADFQSKKYFSQTKITRIVDTEVDQLRTIYANQIIQKYGQPILTDSVEDNSYHRRVDIYKNVTFFYEWDNVWQPQPKLMGVVLMKNASSISREKWLNYVSGEVNYRTMNMEKFISSNMWLDM